MTAHPTWHYDEFQQVGRNYGKRAEVEVYDSSHAKFRDIEAESDRVLDRLGIESGDALIDFGSGTGTFAIQAARRGAQVTAVDISEAMLARSREKAQKSGAKGIAFYHAGFLTYDRPDESAEAITTTFALHHLPDFWKGIALKQMRRMLKPGGLLYLHDLIIAEPQALENIEAFIQKQAKAGGTFLQQDAEGHFREEFSTYDWVMDGLISQAELHIIDKHVEGGVLGTYLCCKPLSREAGN